MTICNKNPAKLTNNSDTNDYVDLNIFVASALLNANVPTLDIASFLQYQSTLIGVLLNATASDLATYSFSLTDMLMNCRFNNIDCGGNDFEYFYTKLNGNCYKFNSGYDDEILSEAYNLVYFEDIINEKSEFLDFYLFYRFYTSISK